MKLAVIVLSLLASTLAGQTGPYAGKPYDGKPQVIPGRVQGELYDLGGPGVAYKDADPGNNGSGVLNKGDSFVDRFRKDEGVDISYTKRNLDKTIDGIDEKPEELYLGWTAAGEWVKYTVDVKDAGIYSIAAHLSARYDAARIAVAFDGGDPVPMSLPTTGHWHTWRIARDLARVKLDKGVHVMTLSVLAQGEFNIDYLEFTPAPDAPTAVRGFDPLPPFAQTRRMMRGVNIIGYDPLWNDFSKARFTGKHFTALRDGGFNHVRINLQAFRHMDAQNKLSPAWMKTLTWAVDNALANNLVAILDEHDFVPCGQDAAACKTKLLAFWRQVAPRFKDAPSSVIFEILNEPNQQVTDGLWNQWLKEALAIIRETNPTRTVIIGPAFWNNIHYLDKLELPAGDRNIIVTVHYYLPMPFTHQGAKWNKETANLSGIKWGSDAEKRSVVDDFEGVQKWSKEHDRPILLGEFGAYDKAEMESRALYTSHVARTAESLGWAWSYWQFDSDFIVYDIDKDGWVRPIWKALIPGN